MASAGLIQPTLLEDGQVRVDMGPPTLAAADVPTTLEPTRPDGSVVAQVSTVMLAAVTGRLDAAGKLATAQQLHEDAAPQADACVPPAWRHCHVRGLVSRLRGSVMMASRSEALGLAIAVIVPVRSALPQNLTLEPELGTQATAELRRCACAGPRGGRQAMAGHVRQHGQPARHRLHQLGRPHQGTHTTIAFSRLLASQLGPLGGFDTLQRAAGYK